MKAHIRVYSEHIQIVLRKMCDMVGADADIIDFGESEWYWEHAWTKEQESEFKKWMADYLYNNTQARKEIMSFPRKTKKNCKEVVDFFVFNHGWKRKE